MTDEPLCIRPKCWKCGAPMELRSWNQWFASWKCSKGCAYEFRDWIVGKNINQKDRSYNRGQRRVSFAWDRRQGDRSQVSSVGCLFSLRLISLPLASIPHEPVDHRRQHEDVPNGPIDRFLNPELPEIQAVTHPPGQTTAGGSLRTSISAVHHAAPSDTPAKAPMTPNN